MGGIESVALEPACMHGFWGEIRNSSLMSCNSVVVLCHVRLRCSVGFRCPVPSFVPSYIGQ